MIINFSKVNRSLLFSDHFPGKLIFNFIWLAPSGNMKNPPSFPVPFATNSQFSFAKLIFVSKGLSVPFSGTYRTVIGGGGKIRCWRLVPLKTEKIKKVTLWFFPEIYSKKSACSFPCKIFFKNNLQKINVYSPPCLFPLLEKNRSYGFGHKHMKHRQFHFRF